MKKISAYYRIIQNLTCMGFFFTLIFAVKSFENAVPDEIYVRAGETVSYDFDVPVSVVLKQDSTEVFEYLTKDSPLTYCVNCRLFGIFPVKDITGMLVEPETVYASGMPVGIYMETDGVLVLDTEKMTGMDGKEYTPAQGVVSSGDYITEVNHQKIEGKKQLMDLVEHLDGEKVLLTVRRENTILEKKLTPVQISKGNYRLGIWVRDNVQGLGTITFLTKNNRFAALGHGIHDVDTSTLLTIKRGTLYRTSIQKVQKGSKGNPGTMEGIIVYNRFHQLGVIEKNTDEGIYGELNSDRSWIGEEVPIQVAEKEEIKTGEARIRCYIDGEVKEYSIRVTQIDKESDQVNKGMVIQVTDTELLEKTGGIIQGMSGSPIIQNGKLIGAVTHVFVQDSTKGYGIFIENMLKEEES